MWSPCFLRKIQCKEKPFYILFMLAQKTLDTITWYIVENKQCKFETRAMEQFF